MPVNFWSLSGKFLEFAPFELLKRDSVRHLLSISFFRILAASAFAVALSLFVGEAIDWGTKLSGLEGWQWAMAFHLLLSAAYLSLHRKRNFRILTPLDDRFRNYRVLIYLPALFIFLGATIASQISRNLFEFAGAPPHTSFSSFELASVTLIPIGEEIVYRLGCGDLFRRLVGPIWGTYFTVILFSLAHSDTSLSGWLNGGAGITLGPLLLGAAAQFLFSTFRCIGPVIALHAACNASAIIFRVIDPRWLDWLSQLYL